MADQIPTNVASADEPALAAAANNTVGTSSVFGVSSLPQASVAVSSGPTAAQIANNDAHVHQATLVNHLASGQTLITAINELMHETQNQPHLHHYPPTAPTVQAQEPVPDAPSSQYYATHGLTNQIVQGWNPDDNAHDIVATALGLLEEAQGLIITLQMGGWNGQLNMLNHMLEDLSSLRLGQSVPVASREAVLSFVAGLERVDVESLAGDDKGCGICRGPYGQPVSMNNALPEKPVKLPCGHVFGEECITLSLSPKPEGWQHRLCPLCRVRIGVPEVNESTT